MTLTAVFGVLGLFMFALAVRALRRKRLRGTAVNAMFALLLATLSALFATLIISTQGYRVLTREDVVAHVTMRKLGPQRFEARVELVGGPTSTYELFGDELYMDAHILKWKPIANFLGLHTEYELDRIGGRYVSLEDERTKPRTLFSLAEEKPFDLFDLRRSYPLLAPLVDAEYGSGTFIASEDGGRFEVKISTTGLLIRKVG